MLKFGDTIVHLDRPEWGRGLITRAEPAHLQGKPGQRLHVRFSQVGMKVLHTAAARLHRVDDTEPETVQSGQPVANKAIQVHTLGGGNGVNKAGNGKPTSMTKTIKPGQIEKALLSLPEPATDPFCNVWERLDFTLKLFRFTDHPKDMTHWAVAQTDIDDPLTHITRHELEVYFDRWVRIRKDHLISLIKEAERKNPNRLRQLLNGAPPEALDVLQRLHIKC